MENMRKRKFTITVGLLVITALLATVMCGIWLNDDNNVVSAYEISSEARNATIGDHGVGEVDVQLAPGQEAEVRERHGKDANTEVIWIKSDADLKNYLQTSTAAATDVAAGKILIFANDIDWEQASIANDVGTQKFSGILDGNGYSLNIRFTAPLKNGGTAKSSSNDAYYKVTQSDIGESTNNFSGTDGGGARGMGLVVGVNAGTIANLTVNYSAEAGAMQAASDNGAGDIADSNSLDSAQDPDLPYGYGIVAGINIGTINNVYVNQQSIFNGNTKARTTFNGSSHVDNAEAYENCAAVGGITGINMGYGKINNCYMYVGGAIWAQADGSNSNGTDIGARYSATFAGGIVGWIRGDNSQLTYCYLDGNGDINSWAMRGDNIELGDQLEPWSIAYAGGVTAGKIQLYRESHYTMGVERQTCYSRPLAMGANQVKGIISNWSGSRRDSYGQTSYLDTTNSFTNSPRVYKGMPFDFLYSADQGTDKQDLIVFTYNYKAVNDVDTLDMSHNAYDGNNNSAAKMNANWNEVYSWEHSSYKGDSEVSVTFEGNYLRIQAKSNTFMNTQETKLEDITRNNYVNGYQPKYDSNYQGSLIWGADIYTIGQGVNPETTVASTVYKATDRLGSFVQYYGTTMQKGSYVVKFGAAYDYSIQNANTTSRQYNGDPVTDMLPSLRLTDKSSTITPSESEGKFSWYISSATAGAVARENSFYPDTYYIQPYAVIDGAVNENYAYYDANQRTLAVNKGINSTVVVTKATLSLSYAYSNQWVKDATIDVSFSSNSGSISKQIIDAYSYQGGTNGEIIGFTEALANNSFRIVESTTTPQNGRTIYNVTAYVYRDGVPVAVADTSRAPAANKTVLIKVDKSAPVLVDEQYYFADEFSAYSSFKEMYDAWNADPDAFTALDKDEILSGRWYNKEIIAFASVSDENRSGIATVSVSESADGHNFGDLDGSRFYIDSTGENTVAVIRISTAPYINLTLNDNIGNSVTTGLNSGEEINIDTKPIIVNEIITDYKDYSRVDGKAYSKFQITFNASFGDAGLYMWYYIDNNTTLGDDVTDPGDVEWKRYEFTSNVSSGTNTNTFIPEGMENAALFIKFTSAVDGYDVAEPVVRRMTATKIGLGDFNKFTVDLNGAVIAINASILEFYDSESGTAYRLDRLINGNYPAVNLADLFSKTYDGTVALKEGLEFRFTSAITDDTILQGGGAHYTGDFYASESAAQFTKSWLKLVAEYSDANAGDDRTLNISIETSEESPITMNVSINYGDGNEQKVMSVGTTIEKQNMAFDINQILTMGTDIQMSSGSYVVGEDGNVVFNWGYGNAFDGLIVSIKNDKSSDSSDRIYFRFNSEGKKDEVYMNAGGNYSAYVEAIKIDSDSYHMEDFAHLEKVGDVYVGDAGINFTVEISGTIKIDVQQKEVRLTFRLDGQEKYSFKLPYDLATHNMTATYEDIDGNIKNAKITWYRDGAPTTLSGITDIGDYTAVATIEDTNYKIKGQSQQVISIISTYLDVLVPDKTVQYNDGKAVTYIPDLPEGSAAEGKNIIFTITYYLKQGTSLKLLGTNVEITEVGEYYVSVLFDPEVQVDPELKKFARKEYTKEESTAAAGVENYISFNVIPANTYISGVSNQEKVYNGGKQIIDVSKAIVKSEASGVDVSNVSVTLQYWDDASQAYVDFDSSLNNGKYENVGSYNYRLVYGGDANYNPCSLDLTMDIKAANITGVWFGNPIEGSTTETVGVKQVYSGKPVSIAADITNSNVGKNPDVVVEYKKYAISGYSKDVPEFTNVGTYEVFLRVSCGDNYVAYETSAFIIITTAPYPEDAITFTNGRSATFEYDGKEHAIEYTLNTGKYGAISVTSSNIMQKEAGEYAGTVQVTLANYAGYSYETLLTITPRKVATVDTSSISEIEQNEGLTSDTDLNNISVTFVGVDGKNVEAELTFWNEEGEIVFPDAYGCLPAGTYKVTYSGGDNYDLSGIAAGTLVLAEGTGERPCDHVDSNGDGICDLCGKKIEDETPVCDHVDSNGDGKCDKCGASLGVVTPPQEAPDVVKYVILAVCGVLIVASIVGVIVAAVVKSNKKKNNRYNII